MKTPRRFGFSPEKWAALAARIRLLAALIRLLAALIYLLDKLLRNHML